MTDQEQVPRGISDVADKIGITGQQLADFMGPAFTATMAWFESDSHDIQDLVDTLNTGPAADTPEAHDVGDGFEMSAAECAEFVDAFIRDVGQGGRMARNRTARTRRRSASGRRSAITCTGTAPTWTATERHDGNKPPTGGCVAGVGSDMPSR